MRVLVTGGLGYIGRQTILRLRDAGHEAVALDNMATGRPQENEQFTFMDVRDVNALSLGWLDAVCHCAALSSVEEGERDPASYCSVNVGGTASVVEFCSGMIPLVFSSSAAAASPVSVYGLSKAQAEMGVLDSPHVSLRYFNVAGADRELRNGETRGGHLITNALRSRDQPADRMRLYSKGACVRDYVHVDDVARANVLALEHLVKGGESFTADVGNGVGHTSMEILEQIREIRGSTVPCTLCEPRPGDPASLVADLTVIGTKLGWWPQYTLEDIIRDAMAWEQKLSAQ